MGVTKRRNGKAAIGVLVALQLAPAIANASDVVCEVMPAPEPLSRIVKLLHADDAASCSVHALITHLERATPTRGEFETTAEYEGRKTSEATLSGMPLAQPYALLLPVQFINVRYDADAQGFKVVPGILSRGGRILTSLVNTGYGYTAVPARGVLVQTMKAIEHSEYEGQNGFGAKMSISKLGGESWEVFLRWDANASGPAEAVWPMLPVPRADAPSVKNDLAVVLVGISNAPAAFRRRNRVSPTTDLPIEMDIDQHVLRLAPAYALVIRQDTGQVLLHTAYEANGSEVVLPVGEDLPSLTAARSPMTRRQLQPTQRR